MLGPWIAASLSKPFDRAGYNCALWAADAVQQAVGIDPAADLRLPMRWHDWLCLMRREGGIVNAVARRMDALEVLRPWQGQPEGVAVVALPNVHRLCAVISGGRVVARCETGLLLAGPETIIRGWSWLPR